MSTASISLTTPSSITTTTSTISSSAESGLLTVTPAVNTHQAKRAANYKAGPSIQEGQRRRDEVTIQLVVKH